MAMVQNEATKIPQDCEHISYWQVFQILLAPIISNAPPQKNLPRNEDIPNSQVVGKMSFLFQWWDMFPRSLERNPQPKKWSADTEDLGHRLKLEVPWWWGRHEVPNKPGNVSFFFFNLPFSKTNSSPLKIGAPWNFGDSGFGNHHF